MNYEPLTDFNIVQCTIKVNRILEKSESGCCCSGKACFALNNKSSKLDYSFFVRQVFKISSQDLAKKLRSYTTIE
jgi:hypothetical protein